MALYSLLWICVTLLGLVCPNLSSHVVDRFNSSSLRELVNAACQESLQTLNEASLHYRQRRSSPPSPYAVFRKTDPEVLEVSRAAELFQNSLQALKSKVKARHGRDITAPGLLSWEDVERIQELSQCPRSTHPAICHHSHLRKYRSLSGICNNRQNPLWGAANSALVRWLPAEYEDGEREPKGWNPGRSHNGFPLPPPREVSTKIMKSAQKPHDDAYTQLLVEWGQYIDHDMTFTPQYNGQSASPFADCWSSCDNVHPCFPIQTPDKGSGVEGCMKFFRSVPACYSSPSLDLSQALQRQQMNIITSFIDASMVYGSSPKTASALRDLAGLNGKLAVNRRFADPKGRAYLPFVDALPSPCLQAPHGDRVECFTAGDSRVNEGLPLTVIHTLWLREHNRVAEALKQLNGHWSPETVYQETRKIIGAMHQIITFRDYLPKIIGPESMEREVGAYGGYDGGVDPSASNVFATAAFRFGHATVGPVISRLNGSFQEHRRFPNLKLRDTMFSPWRIVREGGVEPILRGVIGSAAPALASDAMLTEEVTDNLVVLNNSLHMDLAALNLQRGRDHALPGYNDWRAFCGLERIRTLRDLTQVSMDARLARDILKVYKTPDNIDVWLGGLTEKPLAHSRTGPLFTCLIGKQMRAVREGDRFWWEAEGVFTPQQRAELLKGSVSRLVCDNTDIGEVPPDPFRLGTYPDDFLPCHRVPAMDFGAWREERSRDLRRCGSPRNIENGDYMLSSASGDLVALYSCYHGFRLKGAAAAVCEGGRWSDPPPLCTGGGD